MAFVLVVGCWGLIVVHDGAVMVSDEVLKAVVPSQDGDSDEKKSGQDDSAVVDQYKKIIREQVRSTLFENKFFSPLNTMHQSFVVHHMPLWPMMHHYTPHHTTTVLRPFFWDHPGEPVPKENFWTLWGKGRLTEANTPTIQLGATPSGLTSADLCHPIFFTGRMPFLPPNQQCQSTEGNDASLHSWIKRLTSLSIYSITDNRAWKVKVSQCEGSNAFSISLVQCFNALGWVIGRDPSCIKKNLC